MEADERKRRRRGGADNEDNNSSIRIRGILTSVACGCLPRIRRRRRDRRERIQQELSYSQQGRQQQRDRNRNLPLSSSSSSSSRKQQRSLGSNITPTDGVIGPRYWNDVMDIDDNRSNDSIKSSTSHSSNPIAKKLTFATTSATGTIADYEEDNEHRLIRVVSSASLSSIEDHDEDDNDDDDDDKSYHSEESYDDYGPKTKKKLLSSSQKKKIIPRTHQTTTTSSSPLPTIDQFLKSSAAASPAIFDRSNPNPYDRNTSPTISPITTAGITTPTSLFSPISDITITPPPQSNRQQNRIASSVLRNTTNAGRGDIDITSTPQQPSPILSRRTKVSSSVSEQNRPSIVTTPFPTKKKNNDNTEDISNISPITCLSQFALDSSFAAKTPTNIDSANANVATASSTISQTSTSTPPPNEEEPKEKDDTDKVVKRTFNELSPLIVKTPIKTPPAAAEKPSSSSSPENELEDKKHSTTSKKKKIVSIAKTEDESTNTSTNTPDNATVHTRIADGLDKNVDNDIKLITGAYEALDKYGRKLVNKKKQIDDAINIYKKSLKLKRIAYNKMKQKQKQVDDIINKYPHKFNTPKRSNLSPSYGGSTSTSGTKPNKQMIQLLSSIASSINNICYLKQQSIADANTNNNIGNSKITKPFMSFNEIMKSYQDSLTIKKEILGKDHISVGMTLNNIGAAYYCYTKEYNKAMVSYAESYRIISKHLGHTNNLQIATLLSNMADIYYITNEHISAHDFYKEALNIRWKLLGQHDDRVERLLTKVSELEMIGSQISFDKNINNDDDDYDEDSGEINQLRQDMLVDQSFIDDVELELEKDVNKSTKHVGDLSFNIFTSPEFKSRITSKSLSSKDYSGDSSKKKSSSSPNKTAQNKGKEEATITPPKLSTIFTSPEFKSRIIKQQKKQHTPTTATTAGNDQRSSEVSIDTSTSSHSFLPATTTSYNVNLDESHDSSYDQYVNFQ